MGRYETIFALLALWLGAALADGCGGDEFEGGDGGTDSDTDSDTGIVDADTDSDTDTDAPDGGDTDTSEAGPGEPCWKDSFGPTHPNAGLPDCVTGYVCVGDATGAWCSEPCDVTGDIDSSDGPFGGWCCAEFSDPCDPYLFWMPAELSEMCVPRSALPTGACTNGGTWPSGAERCAPVCDGEDLLSETVRQAIDEENRFCTFVCDPLGEPCESMYVGEIGDVFSGGCCELWGVSYLCTPAGLCG